MKIAMIGQKGVVLTVKSGGIEKHVAEVATHLTDRGHQVTVYARKKYAPEMPEDYHGVRLKYLPTIYLKWFEAIVHTFVCTIHALFEDYDIIHYHGVGPATLAWIPRLFARKATTVVTFHSQDQFHTKWGPFARAYLHIGNWAAATFPEYCIAVSHEIQVYCREHYGKEVVYIPNGSTVKVIEDTDALEPFGLEKENYLLNVGRIVPQKGLQYLITAFKQLKTDKQLVFVGAPSFSDAYYKTIRALAEGDDRIHFLGFQTGETLEQLFAHAYLYCQPSDSEGLPVVVLEAMGFGTAPLVSDIPANVEAIHGAGLTFEQGKSEDLKKVLEAALRRPDHIRSIGEEARAIIETKFSWDAVTEKIEGVYITSRH
jgi:glycosyltransferase involved in cell wall biosynthesis